jgi:hypothetical protein
LLLVQHTCTSGQPPTSTPGWQAREFKVGRRRQRREREEMKLERISLAT